MAGQIEVGILGATGMVGQEFVAQLADHPWFTVSWIAASERSAGKRYRDATSWRLPAQRPDRVADMVVDTATPGRAPRLVFSGLDASVAGEVEAAFAQNGHLVVSNARNHRMDPVVPLVIPEVNADHLRLLTAQAESKGWSGGVVTNPNCSTVVLAMAVAPLRQFGLRQIIVSTLQAISGGGYPGVASLDIMGNVVPVVRGEEVKIETETKKILGPVTAAGVEAHPVTVSASTTRVPVINGHTELVTVSLESDPGPEALIAALRDFSGPPLVAGLPSAPSQPVLYLEEEDRPQPRLDADRGHGMTVCVGRLRACPVLDYKFVAMGHNTVRGAAGVAVLNAELLKVEGKLD